MPFSRTRKRIHREVREQQALLALGWAQRTLNLKRENLDRVVFYTAYKIAFNRIAKSGNSSVILYLDEAIRVRHENFVALLEAGACKPLPGSLELVHAIADAGLKLGLASSSPQKKAEATWAAIGLPSERFDALVSGDMVTHKKPHPMLYQQALQRMGLTAAQCVAVEDSAMGLAAAKAAGLAALVTINEDTRDQNFAGAGLIVSSLGGPGDPVWVYRGDMGQARWVTVNVLARLLASGQKT